MKSLPKLVSEIVSTEKQLWIDVWNVQETDLQQKLIKLNTELANFQSEFDKLKTKVAELESEIYWNRHSSGSSAGC